MLPFINYIKDIKIFNKNSNSNIENSFEFSFKSEENNICENNKSKVTFALDENDNLNHNQNDDLGIYYYLGNIIIKYNIFNLYEISNLMTTIITILVMTIKILINKLN